MAAETTIKISVLDHQALANLLAYLHGGITETVFRAVLEAQGRDFSKLRDINQVVALVAEQMYSRFK